MDHLVAALLTIISYVESREVPDEIADDDVAVLEETFYHLRQCNEAERSRLENAARLAALKTDDIRRQQSLLNMIENLEH
jgi:hypothetical protein